MIAAVPLALVALFVLGVCGALRAPRTGEAKS